MEATKLVKQLLQFPPEWKINEVNFKETEQDVHIHIEYKSNKGVCKGTGEICSVYDYRPERAWRHLDMLDYHCYLHCSVPRVKNSFGEVVSVPLPWAEDEERHTKKFEDYAIKVLKATHNQTKAGELLGVSYEKMNRVMCNSVERGLQRRQLDKEDIPTINIDEKSYKKGHQYATVISDSKGSRILEVGKNRTQAATEELLDKTFTEQQLQKMKAVCVDMWDPFIAAVKKNALMLRLCTTNFMWSNISIKA